MEADTGRASKGSCLLLLPFPFPSFSLSPYLAFIFRLCPSRKPNYQFRKCIWTTSSTEGQTFPTGLPCPKQRPGPSLSTHSRDFSPQRHQLVTQKPWHIYPTGQCAAIGDKHQAQHNFHPWVPIHGPVNNICNARERDPCPAPQGFHFHCSGDAVDPEKSQVRTKVLDALGQHLLKRRLQLCKSFKLICCIICQDFYSSWKGFGEKHLFSFQNHQVALEQWDEGSPTTLHQGD